MSNNEISAGNHEEIVPTEQLEATEEISEESQVDESVDYKAELDEARAEIAKYKRIAKQKAKKATKKTDSKSSNGELGYGEKAFPNANGIKGSDEYAIIQEAMEATGKTLDEVVENKFVKSELEELRGSREVEDAIPNGKSRSNQSHRNEVDYWVAKGELPPKENVALRRKVVNARISANKNKSKFGSTSVEIR